MLGSVLDILASLAALGKFRVVDSLLVAELGPRPTHERHVCHACSHLAHL